MSKLGKAPEGRQPVRCAIDAIRKKFRAKPRSDSAKISTCVRRASREAANRLYRRMGFATRETNVYRHSV